MWLTQEPPPQNGGFSPSRTWRRGVHADVVAIKGYQAGVGGEGVGVQPPGLFFFVWHSFFGLYGSPFMYLRSTAFCIVMQESTARGVENRCIFIHKTAYECIMMQNPTPLVNNFTPGL